VPKLVYAHRTPPGCVLNTYWISAVSPFARSGPMLGALGEANWYRFVRVFAVSTRWQAKSTVPSGRVRSVPSHFSSGKKIGSAYSVSPPSWTISRTWATNVSQ